MLAGVSISSLPSSYDERVVFGVVREPQDCIAFVIADDVHHIRVT